MKLEEIHGIAKAKGVAHLNVFKKELVKSIQVKEGNFDCYATACKGECDQPDCLWREDCLTTSCKT